MRRQHSGSSAFDAPRSNAWLPVNEPIYARVDVPPNVAESSPGSQ